MEIEREKLQRCWELRKLLATFKKIQSIILLNVITIAYGRGKHGSAYRVVSEELGMALVVKRVRDWGISNDYFRQRMERFCQLKNPHIIPAIALYSSRLEKLLVYEYQENGDLFSLLHGTEGGKTFDWSSRLTTAATIADALAFMDKELRQYGIAHGVHGFI